MKKLHKSLKPKSRKNTLKLIIIWFLINISCQLISGHSCRQIWVVPLIHCGTVFHLLAERVYVSAFAQQLWTGLSVTKLCPSQSFNSPLCRINRRNVPTKLCGGKPSLKRNSSSVTLCWNSVSNDTPLMSCCRVCRELVLSRVFEQKVSSFKLSACQGSLRLNTAWPNHARRAPTAWSRVLMGALPMCSRQTDSPAVKIWSKHSCGMWPWSSLCYPSLHSRTKIRWRSWKTGTRLILACL